jgi:hypothetical protein
VVGDVWRSNCAKAVFSRTPRLLDSQDRVMLLQNLEVISRDIAPRLLVSIRRPIELGEVDTERAKLLGGGLDDLHTGFNHLGADSICSDLGDGVNALSLG